MKKEEVSETTRSPSDDEELAAGIREAVALLNALRRKADEAGLNVLITSHSNRTSLSQYVYERIQVESIYRNHTERF